ncbi:MAG: LysE family translocator [Alphaproteobacteria bacterium]|nr:threonine transporter [Rhizobiaceae bacterium]MBU3963876.1 LysE family translocator [Alphaproteobacteria bacterium]MBU4051583.1 LysE family translocator [Alphaproteobacteria bacterium]MBU4087132.1 LysE family translocator [Alphaproteobacteria bacterium]MBU4156338.1 LysE family translocator [Alphaproteobacteria bacterium]
MTPQIMIILTTLGLYAMAVVSPGPNFALISRLALAGCRKAAMGATIGLARSATFYAILTIAGLSVLLTRVGWLASLVQVAGGCYLVYLGVKTWLEAEPKPLGERSGPPRKSAQDGVRMGIIVNLSNPKVITFFLSLYAVTMPAAAPLSTKLAVLLGGFLLEIVWYGLVILLFSTPPARAAYDRAGHWIERAIGTALTVFGLKLISEKLWSRGML